MAAASLMPYVNLGPSGLRVSRLSYGAWVTYGNQVQAKEAYELMKHCYQNGVNLFDNAETYADGKAETVMGEAIKMGIDKGTWERDDLVVTSKYFFGYKNGANARGLSRKHIVEGVNATLKRMNLEYLDIIFCHRPDPMTPIEETVRAMNHVIDKGQAFYWATSEWDAREIAEAWSVAKRLGLQGPIAEQPQYNLFHRDKVEVEFAPLYKDPGLGLTTWSPLASGVLTGKYSGGKVPEGSRLGLQGYEWLADSKLKGGKWQIDKTDELKPVADELGCTQAQLAVAWCLANPNVSTVLLGATKISQLDDNFGALQVVPKLTKEVMDRIDSIVNNPPKPSDIHQQVARMRQWPPKK